MEPTTPKLAWLKVWRLMKLVWLMKRYRSLQDEMLKHQMQTIRIMGMLRRLDKPIDDLSKLTGMDKNDG